MPTALAFNPGSNSLKFDMAEISPGARTAGDLHLQASGAIDDIGKEPQLVIYEGRKVVEKQPCRAQDMGEAVRAALEWLQEGNGSSKAMQDLAFAAVRVVHGGEEFDRPMGASAEVRDRIRELEMLAPLHNKSSLEVLQVLDGELPSVRKMALFDTAFHRTLPEVAWRYPIERETADRFGVRKFGFHGLSHRYMLNAYAAAANKEPSECTVVTLHLESGSSACAIRRGESVDTTMGLTPLEGLMMGTRSGSIDPAIVPFLTERMGGDVGEVMKVLEKESGLLGIAGDTLDTRELVRREDRWAKLALEMFSYRVRLAVGAYLAVLGDACEAVVFGGGIGEDSPWLRASVCAGLRGWGLDFDGAANNALTEGQGRITTKSSRLEAWGMAVEEGLQMIWECGATS